MSSRMPEETHAFLESSLSSEETSSGLNSSDSNADGIVARQKPTPRKGHPKSRRGCLSCKRRRVKCQEDRPECGHCRRLGLSCQYPVDGVALLAPANALRATPTQFTMEDLRFFQHFLLTAYPPLPLKADFIWKDVAALSHSYDYLIHAMLGLAASHLNLCVGSDFATQALAHRVESINSLNRALSQPCVSPADGDARFATVMALTFQSGYMHDGMLDFLSMVRGCVLVYNSAMQSFGQSAFQFFSSQEHNRALRSLNDGDVPYSKDSGELDSAIASLRALGPLCKSILEVQLVGLLENMLNKAKTSRLEAAMTVAAAYDMLGEAAHAEYSVFSDPTNYPAQIILAHFFVVEYLLMSPILHCIQDGFRFRKPIVAKWVRQVAESLPEEYEQYLRWPLRFPNRMTGVEFVGWEGQQTNTGGEPTSSGMALANGYFGTAE